MDIISGRPERLRNIVRCLLKLTESFIGLMTPKEGMMPVAGLAHAIPGRPLRHPRLPAPGTADTLLHVRPFCASPVKTKAIKALCAVVTLSVVALVFVLPRSRRDLPHFPLRDGFEFRVVQITYTSRASDSTDHNIGAATSRLWLWNHLPPALRRRVSERSRGIGYQSSTHPVLSIWWASFQRATNQPLAGPAGDVLMTLDSGQQINLGVARPRQRLPTDFHHRPADRVQTPYIRRSCR